MKEENELRRNAGAFESKELLDVLGDKITFKQFTETYHLGFFEKKRFAKFIDTLGLGWYDTVSWREMTWEMYYLKMKHIIEEMANCRPNKTGLPMNIWIDETSAYLNGGHTKRIKFQINKNPLFQTSNSCPMLLDGTIPEKVFTMVKNNKEYKLTTNDIEMVSNFVKNNSYALSLIADQKVWIDDFWEFCIKGGEPASPSEIEKLKQDCNSVLH